MSGWSAAAVWPERSSEAPLTFNSRPPVLFSSHLLGNDWDHAEVGQAEAAELCQRVSELSLTSVGSYAQSECLICMSAKHQCNRKDSIRGLWSSAFTLLILRLAFCFHKWEWYGGLEERGDVSYHVTIGISWSLGPVGHSWNSCKSEAIKKKCMNEKNP